MYTNADQLTNKRDDLLMVIADDTPDLIFITECLPKFHAVLITAALLSISGYTMFTNFERGADVVDRLRGICVYVRAGLQVSELNFVRTPSIEQLWISVRLRGAEQLIAGCLYRSPSRNAHQCMDEIAHLLYSVLAASPSHLLICGDFNIPQIDWASSFCQAPELHYAHRFLNIIHNCLLFQHVLQPTRFREGETPHILDLLFTNEEGMVSGLTYLPGLGKSDHIILRFQLICYPCQAPPSMERLKFHKANWVKLRSMLASVNWHCLTTLDIDAGYKFFQETLSAAVSACIPTGRSTKARKNIYLNSQAFQLKKEKNMLWDKYMHSRDPLDLARFRVSRNKLRTLTRKLRHDFEHRLVTDLKQNPKAFWRYSNTRHKAKSTMGDLRSSTGELEHTPKGKADILNSFFVSVFTNEDLHRMPVLTPRDPAISELSDIDISTADIERRLSALKACSAPGPDGIHPCVLRETHQELREPLSLLFRRSLDMGRVPSQWKLGRVTPIFKKGDKTDPGNYRPVSLTAVPCKVLESLIRDKLLQHLTEYELISDNQHGFRPKRSCSTQLLGVLEDWSKALELHSPVDIMYLDFQKAFDAVPHQRLLHKLRCYGVSGKLLAWIQSFLTDRKQHVVLQGCSSDWSNVASGVPQGSVLGPLLFLLYINDLPENVNDHIRIFADDTKLYSAVPSQQDRFNLQADLDALVRWSDVWQLPFNEGKCRIMHMGHANPNHQYTLRGLPMSDTLVEKDLGVHIDTDLKFRRHASTVVAKATQVLAVVRRSFASLDTFTLPLLYKTLVRPHIEYGNLVWGPFNRADQKLVERVQRRATRLVSSIRHLPYEERLRRLRLPSLYYRRKRGDMIFMYQLFNGGVDVNPEDFFSLVKGGTTRGHPFKVQKPRAECRVRRSAFSVRVVNSWNALPAHVVCSSSLTSFKKHLDAHWAHIWYDMPDT